MLGPVCSALRRGTAPGMPTRSRARQTFNAISFTVHSYKDLWRIIYLFQDGGCHRSLRPTDLPGFLIKAEATLPVSHSNRVTGLAAIGSWLLTIPYRPQPLAPSESGIGFPQAPQTPSSRYRSRWLRRPGRCHCCHRCRTPRRRCPRGPRPQGCSRSLWWWCC